jgi:hypothetical protein
MRVRPTGVIVAAVLAVLAAGCSGSPSPSAGGSSGGSGPATLPSAVAYSHCMRTHGVPKFPDPGSNGQVPKADAQQLGVSSPQLQVAERDCQHLYPTAGGSAQQEEQRCYVAGDCPPALTQRMMTAALRFARCMRAHGVPNFPDPKPPSQRPATGGAQPAPSGGFTANPNSPAYRFASNDCRSLADATPVSAVQQSQATSAQLRFAVCMRADGVPNYPDPTSTGEIGNDGAISGVNPNSPAYRTAEKHCSKLVPPPPGPPVAAQPG